MQHNHSINAPIAGNTHVTTTLTASAIPEGATEAYNRLTMRVGEAQAILTPPISDNGDGGFWGMPVNGQVSYLGAVDNQLEQIGYEAEQLWEEFTHALKSPIDMTQPVSPVKPFPFKNAADEVSSLIDLHIGVQALIGKPHAEGAIDALLEAMDGKLARLLNDLSEQEAAA